MMTEFYVSLVAIVLSLVAIAINIRLLMRHRHVFRIPPCGEYLDVKREDNTWSSKALSFTNQGTSDVCLEISTVLDPCCPAPPWAIMQARRGTGLIEDVCEHGIGHPNREWLRVYGDRSHLSVHGCDGCCTQKHKEDA